MNKVKVLFGMAELPEGMQFSAIAEREASDSIIWDSVQSMMQLLSSEICTMPSSEVLAWCSECSSADGFLAVDATAPTEAFVPVFKKYQNTR